ncbi:MAG: UDP-N-acetylmuramate:L-alanyl-gamma-D-glutamyl-meso-diaminopimelate ligase [Deltaproteobacteria bacterium]|nr:MAG: UDP-N-acetylmuramate:L-alanyl-gamma-D-glutamyl-meso-diaminopimelate ligase [Deltaproteobacteria bacterium]
MFDLDMCLNKVPEKVRGVHLMGICGTGMGALAGMLKEKGLEVTGSDTQVYPPMSTFLASLDIKIFQGYSPDNINHHPDLVIVGNVIRRENEEVRGLAEKKIPFVSFPQALRHLFLKGKIPLVVAGTHGKTTTASILAAILEHAGLDPGFMIGGIVKGFGRNYKLGQGPYFVIEGDEYDTAFFDKGPKFLHYQPHIAILTSVEFDHADIYRDLAEVKDAFRRFVRIIPASGALVAHTEDGIVREVIKDAPCPVIGYGEDKGLTWTLADCLTEEGRTRFSVKKEGGFYAHFTSPLIGRHNALNTLAVIAVLDRIGLSPEAIQAGLSSFQGVCRRQEVRGIKNDITVIDDFAHHPTAVRETLLALRAAYPGRRLIAVFEPRTNSSRRKVFQDDYAHSFDAADSVIVREPPGLENIPEQDRFSSRTLVEDLKTRGRTAYYFPDTDGILGFLKEHVRGGDVIAIMSNGGFDNIHEKLLAIL